jgi:hypothetical protein
MRVVRALVLPAAVAALALFGWTYDVPGPPPPPLSGAELAWVAAARDWLRTPVAQRCATPPPPPAPTGRLELIGGSFADACEEQDPARAAVRLREARARLAGELRDRQELLVEGGLSGRSRVEPRLGEALEALAADGGPVEVRCWAQADWRGVLAEESALTGAAPRREWIWLPAERSLQLQGVHCGPLVRLAAGEEPRARGRRVDLALALWSAAVAAENVSLRPCVPAARLALVLGGARGYVFGLVRFARRELRPVLPRPSRRCRTSRPSS